MAGRLAGALVAASALSAQAFLIPFGTPSGSPVDLLTLANHDWQIIKLACPDCVLPSSAKADVKESSEVDEPVFSIQGGANSLLVNITTLFGGKAVGIDNSPLYPPLATYVKPVVDVVSSSASLVEIKKSDNNRHPVTVTGSTSFTRVEQVAPEGDAAVVRIKYQISHINDHPVTVDTIEVTALRAADNEMTLISVESIPTDKIIFDSLPSVAESDKAPKKQCNMPPLLCHWREMFEAKLGGLKAHGAHRRPGCHGKGKGKHLPTHIRPGFIHHGEGHRPEGHHGKHPMMMDGPDHPHHGGHGGHGGHGHHAHRHHAALHRFIAAFAPIIMLVSYFMLGALAGFVACRLGAVVGFLIVMAWRRFGRGGRRGYESVDTEEDDALVEAKGDEDGLPVYTEEEPVPIYQEKDASTETKQ